MVDRYVIATWPDGMKIIRPLQGKGSTLWFLVNSVGTRLASLDFYFPILDDPARWVRTVRTMWLKDVQPTRTQTNAVIWVIDHLIKAGGTKIGTPHCIPVPSVGIDEDLKLEVHRLEIGLTDISDPGHFTFRDREEEWTHKTDFFLRYNTDFRIGPGVKENKQHRPARTNAGVVEWYTTSISAFSHFSLRMMVPSLSDIEKGKSPTWSVHKDGADKPLASSTRSPYRALLKAGLYATDADHAIWMEEHSLPGALSEGLQMYLMLGLTLPVLFDQTGFEEWIEGLES